MTFTLILASISSLLTFMVTCWYFLYFKVQKMPLKELISVVDKGSLRKVEQKRLIEKYNDTLLLLEKNNLQPSHNPNGIDLTKIDYKYIYISSNGNKLDPIWYQTDIESKVHVHRVIYIQPTKEEVIYLDNNLIIENYIATIFKKTTRGFSELDFKILQFKNKFINDHKLKFVVNCSNLIFKNSNQIKYCYEELKRKLNVELIESEIVIEINIPLDLIQENKEQIINIDNKFIQAKSKNPISEYVKGRNDVYKKLFTGGQLGNIDLNKYSTPKKLINEKFNIENFNNNSNWRVFNIYGPPGTGKSDLLEYLLKNILSENNYLKIVLKENVSIDKLKDISTESNFLKSILTIILDVNNNFLTEFDISDDTILGVKDILSNLILQRRIKLMLIIDDYHIRKDIAPIIEKILDKNWNTKLILVGRPKINTDLEDILFYKTRLWNLEESTLILNNWLDNSASLVDSALKTKWVEQEENYSTYLLRIIKNNIQSISSKDSSLLLYQEVETILKPLYNELQNIIPQRKSDRVVKELENYRKLIFDNPNITTLDKLKEEINIDNSSNKISFEMEELINDIGSISLVGRLSNSEKHLDVRSLCKSSGIIELESEAKKFLQSGSSSGVFYPYNPFTKSSEWKDALIADGCIALRLIYDLEKLDIHNDSSKIRSFTQTLGKLKEKNSLYILRLALDIKSIKRLVKMVLVHNIDYAQLVFNEIVTDSFIGKLKNPNKDLENLFTIIFDNLHQIKEKKNVIAIAKVLSQLISFDDTGNFKRKVTGLISIPNLLSEIGLSVEALTVSNKDDFFKQTDKLNIDRIHSLKIAMSVWNINMTVPLRDRIKAILHFIGENKKDKIIELWTYRLNHLSFKEIKILIDQLVNLSIVEEKESRINLLLIEHTFKKVKNQGRRIDFSMSKSFTDAIIYSLNRLRKEKKYQTLSKLIKWHVYFLAPDMFREDIEWQYFPHGNYAIPKHQFDSRTVIEILNEIPQQSCFSIPHSSELNKLKKVKGKDDDFNQEDLPISEELVSDRFPKNFNYLEEEYSIIKNGFDAVTIVLKSTEIGILNSSQKDGKIYLIDRENQLRKKLKWRPKISLD